MTIEDIISKKQFSEMVESVAKEKRMTYMDAVIYVCQERMIDPLDVGPLISAPLKSRIEQEAIADKLLKGTNTLPI
jgi:Phage late-transcription coactivator